MGQMGGWLEILQIIKMKTYILIISEYFPKTHSRAGELTNFNSKIKNGEKLHTIRANYVLWAQREKEINAGKAILSVRKWSGSPRKSKQVELFQLTKIGVQKLDNPNNLVNAEIDGNVHKWEDVAKNDGLSFVDFCEWFKVRPCSPMAIVQFSDYRY